MATTPVQPDHTFQRGDKIFTPLGPGLVDGKIVKTRRGQDAPVPDPKVPPIAEDPEYLICHVRSDYTNKGEALAALYRELSPGWGPNVFRIYKLAEISFTPWTAEEVEKWRRGEIVEKAHPLPKQAEIVQPEGPDVVEASPAAEKAFPPEYKPARPDVTVPPRQTEAFSGEIVPGMVFKSLRGQQVKYIVERIIPPDSAFIRELTPGVYYTRETKLASLTKFYVFDGYGEIEPA